MRLASSVVVAFVVLIGGTAARAQALADRVPGDALFYAAWAGVEKLETAYGPSHLKGVVDESSLPELFRGLAPAIARRLEQERDPGAQQFAKDVLPVLTSIAEAAWGHPTALYVGPMDLGGKVPMPKVALLCQAGKDAAAVQAKVKGLTDQIPADAPVKIRVRVAAGDLLVVSNFDFPDRMEETLSGREQFKNAMKQGRPEPAIAVFFDAEKVLNMASLVINMGGDDRTTNMWRRVLLTTGIAGVKRIYVTAGFDGKDWGTQAFVESPQPRMGLLAAMLESQPVGDDLFKLAPKGATWVAATRVDLAKVMADVRAAVTQLDPNAGHHVDDALDTVNKALGLDVQADLLGPLGDEWIAYNSPTTGNGALGLVLVKPLKDAAKAEKSLMSLQEKATALMAQMGGHNGPVIGVETTKVDGLTVHTLAVPAVAPSWAIKDGRLYVALFPQVLTAAAAHDPAGAGATILANEDFVASRKRLGVEGKAASFSHMDLPKLAPRGYPLVLAAQQTVSGFADLVGLQTPPMVLPPLNKIMPHLAPSASATWVDDAGWHWRAVTPFPGAELFGGEQAMAAVAGPVVAAVAVPAGARARQQAEMVRSASNLRQIGMGVMMYTNDHKEALPPDLGALVTYLDDLEPAVMGDRPGKPARPGPGAKPADVAKWVNENSDYVYLGGGRTLKTLRATPSEFVIAHEKFELARNGIVNVAFADGHVEAMPVAVAKEHAAAQARPGAK